MIIIIVNNKGGTGKTTTTVNLSAALAHSGYRVLMIDLDSQSSASVSLGIPWNKLAPSIADVLYQKVPVHQAIRRSIMQGLDLITSDIELANCDIMLSELVGRENRLKECLDEVTPYYDFVLCDCPPSISLLSVTALVAADQFIVPVTPEYLALEGLISWMNVVKRVEKGIGTSTELMGILLTLVNPGLGDTKKISDLIREHYGNSVFQTEILKDGLLTQAPSHGKSILEYAPASSGARTYSKLAGEVIQRAGAPCPAKQDRLCDSNEYQFKSGRLGKL